jgi:hypothetical protein
MKPTITVDFDDTLFVKSFPTIALDRLAFFKTMVSSGIFRVVIVTARTKNITDITEFCQKNGIPIDGIIHSAGDKLAIIKELRSIAHFDDSEKICQLLAENGINTFYMGEFLSPICKEEWKAGLVASGTWKYYVLDNNTRGMEG